MSARTPRTGGITTEQIAELRADARRDLELERDLGSFTGRATARARHLYTALVDLVARKLGSRWPDDPAISEALADPDIAVVWRLYREAVDEARDHAADADRATLGDRVLRLALRRDYPVLDAVRAARNDPELIKTKIENDADYQRAKRYARDRKLAPRRLDRMGTRARHWELMTFNHLFMSVIRLRPRYAEYTNPADLFAAIWRDRGRPADIDE